MGKNISPMKWKELDVKTKIMYYFSIAAFTSGILMCFISLFLEPIGVITGSVLGFCGMMLTFTGAVFGMNLHYKNELDKFESNVISTLINKIPNDNDIE